MLDEMETRVYNVEKEAEQSLLARLIPKINSQFGYFIYDNFFTKLLKKYYPIYIFPNDLGTIAIQINRKD